MMISRPCARPQGGCTNRLPDHADAAIWGITELTLGVSPGADLFEYYDGLIAEKAVEKKADTEESLKRFL